MELYSSSFVREVLADDASRDFFKIPIQTFFRWRSMEDKDEHPSKRRKIDLEQQPLLPEKEYDVVELTLMMSK